MRTIIGENITNRLIGAFIRLGALSALFGMRGLAAAKTASARRIVQRLIELIGSIEYMFFLLEKNFCREKVFKKIRGGLDAIYCPRLHPRLHPN